MSNQKGFIFAVLYTSNGSQIEGEHLGYQIVLMDEGKEEPRVIVHRDHVQRVGEASVERFMEDSLAWAVKKYPEYALKELRVRKGPMPLSPDEQKKAPSQVFHDFDEALAEATRRLGAEDRFVMGMRLARAFMKQLENT